MGDLDFLSDLPMIGQLAVICLPLCATALFMLLICAPRRDYFFLRWRPETRFLVLLVLPAVLIIWPVLLFNCVVRSRGVDLDELDFYDD